MIKIKLGSNDKNYLYFKEYEDVVRFLRVQTLPWRDCRRKNNIMDYKKEVVRRAKIMYGEDVLVRVLSDREFITDLKRLGEIAEVIECQS